MSLVAFTRSSSALDPQMLSEPARMGNLAGPSASRYHRSLSKPKSLQSAYFDENQGVWKCRFCSWTYPFPRPSAYQRREHKKICQETRQFQHWQAEVLSHEEFTGFKTEGLLSFDDELARAEPTTPRISTTSVVPTPSKDAAAGLLATEVPGESKMSGTGDVEFNQDISLKELTRETAQNKSESRDAGGILIAQDDGVKEQSGQGSFSKDLIDLSPVSCQDEETLNVDFYGAQSFTEQSYFRDAGTAVPYDAETDIFDFTWIERSDVAETDDMHKQGIEEHNDGQVEADNLEPGEHEVPDGIPLAGDRTKQDQDSISVEVGENSEGKLTAVDRAQQEPDLGSAEEAEKAEETFFAENKYQHEQPDVMVPEGLKGHQGSDPSTSWQGTLSFAVSNLEDWEEMARIQESKDVPYNFEHLTLCENVPVTKNKGKILKSEDVAETESLELDSYTRELERSFEPSSLRSACKPEESGAPSHSFFFKPQDILETKVSDLSTVITELGLNSSPHFASKPEETVGREPSGLGVPSNEVDEEQFEVVSPDSAGLCVKVEGLEYKHLASKPEETVGREPSGLGVPSNEVDGEQFEVVSPDSAGLYVKVEGLEYKQLESKEEKIGSIGVSSLAGTSMGTSEQGGDHSRHRVNLSAAETNWEDWDDVIKNGYIYIKNKHLVFRKVADDEELPSDSHLIEGDGTHALSATTSELEIGQTSGLGLNLSSVIKNWEDWEDVAKGDDQTTTSSDAPFPFTRSEQAVPSQMQGADSGGDLKVVGDNDGLGEVEQIREERRDIATAAKEEPGQISRVILRLSSAERNWEDWEHVVLLPESDYFGGQEKDSILEWEGVVFDGEIKGTPTGTNDGVPSSCLCCTNTSLHTANDQGNLEDNSPNQTSHVQRTMDSDRKEKSPLILPESASELPVTQSNSSKQIVNAGRGRHEGKILRGSSSNYSHLELSRADWEHMTISEHILPDGGASPGLTEPDKGFPVTMSESLPEFATKDACNEQPLKRPPRHPITFQAKRNSGSRSRSSRKASSRKLSAPSSKLGDRTGLLSFRDLELGRNPSLFQSFHGKELAASNLGPNPGDGFSRGLSQLVSTRTALCSFHGSIEGRKIASDIHKRHLSLGLVTKDGVEQTWSERSRFDLLCPVCGSLITNSVVIGKLKDKMSEEDDSRLRTSPEITPRIPEQQHEQEDLDSDTFSDEEPEAWNKSLGACLRYFLSDS